jgi:hypothetical protein
MAAITADHSAAATAEARASFPEARVPDVVEDRSRSMTATRRRGCPIESLL